YELVNGNYSKSIELYIPSIAGAEAARDNNLLLRDYLNISEAYQKNNDYPKAFAYLKKYLQLSDSIGSDDKKKSVLKSQAEYEFKEKEFQLRSEKEKQKLLFDIEKGKQKTQRIYFVVILVLFAGGLAAVAVGYRRKSKDHSIILGQKEEIEKQKHIVDEKNKEVFDSISYAKRLQKAILPPHSLVKDYLPGSFILYKPKDIVAGDFYWMHVNSELRAESSEKKPQHNELRTTTAQLILIAAADCTGHGVPGAMVSIVCSNALNRAVNEFGLTDPGSILDKTRELVIETFEKSEEKVKDGMDISLCSILRAPDSNQFTIQWAGANNPLLYLQNNVLHELKANKQPIGIVEKPTAFTTHTLQLNSGDCVYLFTDGYLDQFGGPNGKKYKHKPFVSLIDRLCRQPMGEQEQVLSAELAGWKGNIDQVDDILVIGFKL
ncbi:MAG: SpoIIE family protein phosphatase, partial [Bacteroidia bacterium]